MAISEDQNTELDILGKGGSVDIDQVLINHI